MLKFTSRMVRSLLQRNQEAQMKRQEQQFKKFVEDLSMKENYLLKDFKKENKDQINSNKRGI